MKKVFYLVISMMVLFSTINLNTIDAAASAPKLKINNVPFVTPKDEPAPYINKDGRTMGSLRLVANAVGVSNSDIKWDSVTSTATLIKEDREVKVTLGKKEISVNGKTVKMDTVAEMKLGRVFIPARFIAESLGLYVGFNSMSNTILISQTPVNEQTTNNIEEVLGLQTIEQLPYTTNVSGFEFTLHEMYVMDYDGEEAQALNKKYDFDGFNYIQNLRKKEKPNLTAYLVRSKVTIKNTGTTTIKYGYDSFEPNYSILTGGGSDATPSRAKIFEVDGKPNNKEVLNKLNIAPNESITSYYYTIINDYNEIKHLRIQIRNKNNYSSIFELAKR